MKAKFKSFATILLAASLVTAAGCGKQASPEASGTANTPAGDGKKVKIGIMQIVEHASLDAARQGFIAALKDNGYEDKKNAEIDYQNAQNDMNNNTTIAQKFAADKKDLVLGVATPSALAAAQTLKDTPVLFTAVSDPVGAKLVKSIESPGGNVTGTSDLDPKSVDQLTAFIAKNFPAIKTIGIVSNEGEQNSQVQVKQAEAAFAKNNIKMVKASASNSSEVKQAAESLVGKADALYVPLDNTVVSALKVVVQVAEKSKKPLFVGENDSVQGGGFAAYGSNYYDLGYTTGLQAVEILKNGKKPADIPVGYPKKLDLAINLKAAKNMGVEVTDAMKAEVKEKANLFE
ncbi:ABC transporter substrate-binding protein [Paenibacillus sp. FJAT-26967]|uniref:ABC transporter substrate-binding protein n=1 Tax=Paenibacillus sp. FJAT-26967 TaxID=1729690 RepID=UPI000839AAAC|nr:ABC transporter substrate-binding protein [Paenibacillus sp. FJAT-26967]